MIYAVAIAFPLVTFFVGYFLAQKWWYSIGFRDGSKSKEKTGKWEHLNWGFDYDRCTECGYEHRYSDAFNYCPNCGATMDGEKEDV